LFFPKVFSGTQGDALILRHGILPREWLWVDDQVRLKGFKMGNVHRNERRGLRERVFESVVGDLTQAIAYRKMGCVDDLTFVERLTNAVGKLQMTTEVRQIVLTRTSRNQKGWDKRLTPQRNRLLLISIHLIRTTAISLPTPFEGGRLLVLKLKGFAAAAGPIKAVAK